MDGIGLQLGESGPEGDPADIPFLARAEVGDHDVRRRDEAGEFVRRTHRGGALVPVGKGVEEASVGSGLVVEEGALGPQGMAARRLGEEDVCAKIPEQTSGEGAGESGGQIEYMQTLKRRDHGLPPAPLYDIATLAGCVCCKQL
jgi:hypothetical protein